MFNQGAGPGLRALILVILSIVLICFDQRDDAFHHFRTRFSSVVTFPFQWSVDAPMRFASWLGASVHSQKELVQENNQLRMQEILLQAQLQKLFALEKENAQLRGLLQSATKISGRVVVARLLAVALDPNLQEVILDKGTGDQVYQGQPVIDAFGVMGQIISVGSLTSKLLLITDKQSAVPVEDTRDAIRAVATGTGSSQLEIDNLPNDNDIQVGDLWVTSGLGFCYPAGYPVGVVAKIEHSGADEKVFLNPAAHLDQAEQVLLAWPDKTKLSQVVQQELGSNS